MDARDGGGVAESLAVRGGSALTKSRRPVWSMTLVIWALAVVAKKIANKTSVVRNMQAVIAVRLAIILTCFLPAPAERVTMPWGRRSNDFRCFRCRPALRDGQPFRTRASRRATDSSCGAGLARDKECLSPATLLAQGYHSNGSTSPGMVLKAFFRADVSVPPPSARSGRPPPLPPSLAESVC